ncbi:hypothetical protein V7S43_009083 [Phytophthora oleae]|uniref:Phospholipid/glycerol acyltransferase domain-containing protein n=1 Tax=Phytophthora oleae TaxID=2107226 RepID=A0ABD3FFU4_9STRA
MAPSVMASPIAPFLDLSMDSLSPTVHGDGKSPVTLDPPTEQQLLPFESMFQFERIKSPLTIGHLFLLLYTPFGLLLLLIRGFCCFLVALIVPRVMTEAQMDRLHIARLFVWITGTRVHLVDEHLFEKGENRADIIVSNHISEFDAVAMLGITPAYILGYDFYKKMLFFKLLGDKAGLVYVPYVSRQQGNGAGRDAVRQIIVERLERGNKPLAAFPEVWKEYYLYYSNREVNIIAVFREALQTGGKDYCSITSFFSRLIRPCSLWRSELRTDLFR